MIRYAVSEIIGDGSIDNGYRPHLQDVVDPETGIKAFVVNKVIAVHPEGHPQAGQPVYPWCLCIASGTKFSLVANDPNVDLLPELVLGMRLSVLDTPAQLAMFARLTARGIDVSGLSQADSFSALIRLLGQLHEPAFSENSFTV